MPTTPGGTVYTVYTATLPGLGRVRWIIADTALTNTRVPTILYAHGANGSVGSFAGGAGVADLRNWLIDNGWLVIEGEGGTPDSSGVTFNHWGNAMNRAAYRAYLEHVAGLIDVGPIFPMGASMGGLITKWLFTRSDIAADCAGLISLAGVGTMFAGDYDTVPGNTPPNITQRSGRYFSPSILNAYSAATYEALEVAAADHAPENWDASVWSGKKILEMYGTADIAVPWSPRGSAPLRALRAGQPAVDLAEEHAGVDHVLAGGTGMHLSVLTDFLIDSLPTDPVPELVFIAKYGYLVRGDGALAPIRSIV